MGAEQVFTVDCELLRGHASTVDELAGGLAAVRPAGAMDRHAYGWLCDFLPPMLGDTSDRGAQALGVVTGALSATAGTLRGNADSFEQLDTAGAPAASSDVRAPIPTLNGLVND